MEPVGQSPPGSDARVIGGDAALSSIGGLSKLGIPAVKRSRVVVLTDPLGLTPSTAMIGLAEQVAGVLERWAGEAP